MPVPIIICDDSSFARKQITRALPAGWDVDITYATNGAEGVEAIAAGKGDIIFLDLTMPVMDGFEVLEHIRKHDLPTLPIVVSGDIQPESQKRVMRLGAVAFIKKPVDCEALSQTLDQYGVLDILTDAAPPQIEAGSEEIELTDFCQEIANVAMGRAADLFAKAVNTNLLMPIPEVRLMEPGELKQALASETGEGEVSIISQGFIGGGIAGEALLLFRDADMSKIADLLHYEGELTEPAILELLMDTSSILLGAFLKGMADLLSIHFSQGTPMAQLYSRHGRASAQDRLDNRQCVLAITLDSTIEEANVHCRQWVLISETSLAKLQMFAELSMEPV